MPYLALLINMVVTMEIFLMVKNPLMLLLAIPIHGVCMLLCSRDPRFFELGDVVGTDPHAGARGEPRIAWKGNSYSQALTLDAPNAPGTSADALRPRFTCKKSP